MTDAYRVVLIGESGVGKTCIIARYIHNKFDPNVISSLTCQFIRKNIELSEKKNVLMDIWDTAGQETHRSLAKIYYKNAKAVILVYDIISKKNFEVLKNYWYEQVKEHCNKDTILAVVANKYDLYEEKQVSNEEGEEFAKSIGAIFVSTSAKNDSGINTLFESIATKILNPDFDFYANEQKKKAEYKDKKKKEEEENNKNKTIKKLNTQKGKNKKNCC